MLGNETPGGEVSGAAVALESIASIAAVAVVDFKRFFRFIGAKAFLSL
jgi:hypothetical protein